MISIFYLAVAAAGAGERDLSKTENAAAPQINNMDWIKAVTSKYSPASWDMLLRYDSYPEIIEATRKGGWIVSMKKPVATFEYLAQGHAKLAQIDFMAMNIRVIALAQKYGVIGLLEEYHAHYLMARFYADMLDAYKEAEDSDVVGFLEWVRNTQSTMASLYEFEFYMRVYLRRMRDKQPEDYASLTACQPFSGAYATLRLACAELIDRYRNLIDFGMKRLHASGQASAVLVNHILWVTNKDGKTYNGTPVLADRDKLVERINGVELNGVVADATEP